MHFDARAAKLLKPGGYFFVHGCSVLRLEVSVSRKTWIYRYMSTDGGRLKQVAIGQRPAMSVGAAVAKWDGQQKTEVAPKF
jgi:cyclopropane fatty-acyl-phospholipid synthase-like methyltransferase